MADQKKGSGLDDLRSRLGLDSVLSKARPPAPKPQPPGGPPLPPPPGAESSEEPSGDPFSTPPPVSPGEEVPSVERTPSADYSAAVSTYEEAAFGEGDPSPVISAAHDMIDSTIGAPISRGSKLAFAISIIVLLALALAAGFGFGKVMRDRQVSNEVINAAHDLISQIRPVADRLNEFQVELNRFGNDFSEELHELFSSTFTGSPPVVGAHTISDGRVIMTTGEDLAQDLLTFALSTQILQGMVQEHLRKSIGDRALIQRLLADSETASNYAVIYDSDELIRSFQAYFTDSEVNPYTPSRGYVVTYDSLEIAVEGEGDTRTFKYDVFAGGQRMQVDIYNMVTLEADQLVTNPNEETALTRYRARVAGIRAQLGTVLLMQDALLLMLEERASADTTFAI